MHAWIAWSLLFSFHFAHRAQIREGDEVDVVKSFSPDNLENLVISRIEMLSARVDDEEEHIIIVARRFKSLTIENYPGVDCYKSSESD